MVATRVPIPANVERMVTGDLIRSTRITIHAGSSGRIGISLERNGATGYVQITYDLQCASEERAQDLLNYALAVAHDQLAICWRCSVCTPVDLETKQLLSHSSLFAQRTQNKEHSLKLTETPAT